MSLTIAIASSLLTISIRALHTVLLLASPDRESHCPDIDLFVSSPQVLILTFSRSLHQAQLGRILHEHRYLLPPGLQELKVILAWRAPKKIGGMLISFRSDSRIDDDTPLADAAVTPST
jgi:hypothetical protein